MPTLQGNIVFTGGYGIRPYRGTLYSRADMESAPTALFCLKLDKKSTFCIASLREGGGTRMRDGRSPRTV